MTKPPSSAKLRFKNRQELPLYRLPFVNAIPAGSDLSFWAVPRSGGLVGGCQTGGALARIYLKHLREHGCDPCGTLHLIALNMLGFPQSAALLGQGR